MLLQPTSSADQPQPTIGHVALLAGGPEQIKPLGTQRTIEIEKDPHQAREVSYTLAGAAVNAGKIAADKVNELVKLGDFVEAHRQLCAAGG